MNRPPPLSIPAIFHAHPCRHGHAHDQHSQHGVVLLETLIAVLVFSLGVLGMVSMLSKATEGVADSRIRTDVYLQVENFINDALVGQTLTDPTEPFRKATTDDNALLVNSATCTTGVPASMVIISFADVKAKDKTNVSANARNITTCFKKNCHPIKSAGGTCL